MHDEELDAFLADANADLLAALEESTNPDAGCAKVFRAVEPSPSPQLPLPESPHSDVTRPNVWLSGDYFWPCHGKGSPLFQIPHGTVFFTGLDHWAELDLTGLSRCAHTTPKVVDTMSVAEEMLSQWLTDNDAFVDGHERGLASEALAAVWSLRTGLAGRCLGKEEALELHRHAVQQLGWAIDGLCDLPPHTRRTQARLTLRGIRDKIAILQPEVQRLFDESGTGHLVLS